MRGCTAFWPRGRGGVEVVARLVGWAVVALVEFVVAAMVMVVEV